MNHTPARLQLASAIGILSLLALCTLSVGCDQMAGAAMEMAIENTTPEQARRDSLMAKLKTERAELPKKINDHTTLRKIKMRGLNRIRYTYLVSESGRPTVNMNFTPERKKECVDRMVESRMAVAMEKPVQMEKPAKQEWN